MYSGGFREALDVAQRAVAALTGTLRYARFGRIFLPGVSARCYAAACLVELGEVTEGCSVGEDAVRLAEEVEHSYSMALALWFVGILRLRQRRHPDGHPGARTRPGALPERQYPAARPIVHCLSGGSVCPGRARGGGPARSWIRRWSTWPPGADVAPMRHVLIELSEALLLVGRVDEASALARRLLDLSRTHTGRGYQAHAYRLLGEVARHREPPDVDQAAAHYRQALALAEDLGMRPLQAHCHLGLGTLYATTGQRQQAQAELSAAIDLYRAMDMTFWLPQAEAALAQAVG